MTASSTNSRFTDWSPSTAKYDVLHDFALELLESVKREQIATGRDVFVYKTILSISQLVTNSDTRAMFETTRNTLGPSEFIEFITTMINADLPGDHPVAMVVRHAAEATKLKCANHASRITALWALHTVAGSGPISGLHAAAAGVVEAADADRVEQAPRWKSSSSSGYPSFVTTGKGIAAALVEAAAFQRAEAERKKKRRANMEFMYGSHIPRIGSGQ